MLFTEEVYPGDTGGMLYDGRQQVLYWADVMSEVAFVVPSPETYQADGRRASADSTSGTTSEYCTVLALYCQWILYCQWVLY